MARAIVCGQPHPGVKVREYYLERYGLSVTNAAVRLGVTRQRLNNVVNGRADISVRMALLLELDIAKLDQLNTLRDAYWWMNQQIFYSIEALRKAMRRTRVAV